MKLRFRWKCSQRARGPKFMRLKFMRLKFMVWALVLPCAVLLAGEVVPVSGSIQDAGPGDEKTGPESSDTSAAAYKTFSLRGRVVWQSAALQRRFGIRQVPEAAERVLALETDDQKLYPLVEDSRGRAFRADPRLRNMEVELLVRQYADSPVVQVIRVFEIQKQKDVKYELDYWCDICSIVMVELKQCECCQAPNDLRRREVTESN